MVVRRLIPSLRGRRDACGLGEGRHRRSQSRGRDLGHLVCLQGARSQRLSVSGNGKSGRN